MWPIDQYRALMMHPTGQNNTIPTCYTQWGAVITWSIFSKILTIDTASFARVCCDTRPIAWDKWIWKSDKWNNFSSRLSHDCVCFISKPSNLCIQFEILSLGQLNLFIIIQINMHHIYNVYGGDKAKRNYNDFHMCGLFTRAILDSCFCREIPHMIC